SFGIGTSNNLLTNAGANNVGGPGLDFQTFWTDTRGNIGPVDPAGENGDFIGVNSFSGSNAPDVGFNGSPVASGSEHNFQFNDGDGRLDLVFEAVDTTGFTQRSVDVKYWINDTSYEADDSFVISLSDGINTVTALSFGESELEANASIDDGSNNWRSLSVDLDAAGLGPVVTLTISADTNSGSENIFLDNIGFKGVPTPGAAGLLALGGLVAARRRR
ncbi:MAG: endonuclease, partial [Planctomycetota bacterium]